MNSEAAVTAAELIAHAGIEASEARLLLAHATGATREALVAHPQRRIGQDQVARFRQLCRRRAAGEPVAYLLGAREFYGRRFAVDPSVLIPRPETETLVQVGIACLEGRGAVRVLELGTGSGCVAITLALEVPGAQVWACDLSEAALSCAAANAAALRADVRFLRSDWYSEIEGRFDLIVSNPPYIAAGDPHLADLSFEPAAALTDGAHGLSCLAEVIRGARAHLKAGAALAVEHGLDQAGPVCELMRQCGFADPRTVPDLGDRPRVSWVRAREGTE